VQRWAVFAIGLAASLALTALLWALGFPGFFLFLLFPFLWFPLAGRARHAPRAPATCPSCGARVQPGFAFCPACGGRL